MAKKQDEKNTASPEQLPSPAKTTALTLTQKHQIQEVLDGYLVYSKTMVQNMEEGMSELFLRPRYIEKNEKTGALTEKKWSGMHRQVFSFIMVKYYQTRRPDRAVAFRKSEILHFLGLSDAGYYYNKITQILGDIDQATRDIETPVGIATRLKWFDRYYVDKKTGNVIIFLNENAIPFIANKDNLYVQTQYINTARLKSNYANLLYIFLQSCHYNKKEIYQWTVRVDDLKKQLDCENYSYGGMVQRVLKPAIQSINESSDINVEYEELKEVGNRTVTAVVFTIIPKSTAEVQRLRKSIYPELYTAPERKSIQAVSAEKETVKIQKLASSNAKDLMILFAFHLSEPYPVDKQQIEKIANITAHALIEKVPFADSEFILELDRTEDESNESLQKAVLRHRILDICCKKMIARFNQAPGQIQSIQAYLKASILNFNIEKIDAEEKQARDLLKDSKE